MDSVELHLNIHKFVVLDLVPESEMQTGMHIEENLNDYINAENRKLLCERHKCETLEDFYEAIIDIKNDLKLNGVVPYIHIEGHGNKEFLYFPNRTSIRWSKVFSNFREINILSKNNLFVSSGACNSAYAYSEYVQKYASMDKACPVFGFLAPETKVQAGGVEDGYIAFYKYLINSNSINDALNAFADATDAKKYALILSSSIFEKVVFNYLTRQCMGKGRKLRQERLLTQVRNETNLPLKKARKALKSELFKSQAPSLQKIHDKFMMCDLYPENRERFNFNAVKFERNVKSGKLKIR